MCDINLMGRTPLQDKKKKNLIQDFLFSRNSFFSSFSFFKKFFFSSFFFFFSRPDHSWPFIRPSHQEHHYQMLGVWVPKFDSKILIGQHMIPPVHIPPDPKLHLRVQVQNLTCVFPLEKTSYCLPPDPCQCHAQISDFPIRKVKKRIFLFFRIEKRGLNLMRSMQQGISTHYNTRFGI